MARDPKPSQQPPFGAPRGAVEVVISGEVALVNITGLVDEHFLGFGDLGESKIVILNVSAMARMTSFGVRQWLKAKDALPRSVTDVYLLGCPTFFVDQLNMVMNFGTPARVLTVIAPYACLSCGAESGETVDVRANRAILAKGTAPESQCSRCGGKLELDETPESYFSFVPKYAASSIQPAAAQVLAARGLYAAPEVTAEKPARIIKLVAGSVTYFRISGTINSMFRARPFLVGAEGEVVIDLAEVDGFEPSGLPEWRRLLKSLAGQVPAVTLVDASESIIAIMADTFNQTRNVAVWSVLVAYRCTDCGRTSQESQVLAGVAWPLRFPPRVCSTCGGTTRNESASSALAFLERFAGGTPAASAKVIANRDEVLSRALTDANVAQAGVSATPSLTANDTILGKYKIVRRLSEGGMAEVFLANQVGIGGFEKPVAIKRIQRQLLDSRHLAIDMFLNEAKIAGRLMHPNIVQVLDVGEVSGSLYLVMEYVHGRDLRAVVKKLREQRIAMPVKEACYIVRETAQALHHAYWSTDLDGKTLNVVHRDVSPHNVILGYDGAVKLLDFGVAMSSVTDSEETMIVGKWQYMSPEHTSTAPIDHRSDLFSLGVVFYLLVAGTMPFKGKDSKEITRAVRAGAFKPLTEDERIPPELAQLIGRMIAADPLQRPQTGQEVVAILDKITTSYGLEASAADMVAMLARLFPDTRTETSVVEILRSADSTPHSKTPVTSSQRQLAIDVSVALGRRESAQHQITIPPPMATKPPDPPIDLRPKSTVAFTWFAIVIGIVVAIAVGSMFVHC